MEEKKDWYCFKVIACAPSGKGFNIIHLSTDHQVIKARSDSFVPEGSKVWVNFPLDYIHLFDENGNRLSW
jgi:hypothetical protein